jgi:hypothetical protein
MRESPPWTSAIGCCAKDSPQTGRWAHSPTRSTLPPEFDIRAGHQLVPTHTLPLKSYDPGEYRLVIAVADRRTGASVEEHLRFTILP